MKKGFLYICLSLFISSFLTLNAQNGLTPARGAESLALGGNVSGSQGIEGILNNQAGLSQVQGFAVIINSEQRFLLSELLVGSLGLAYNKPSFGTIGLLISSFGFDTYQEQKIGLAYSRQLFDNLSIGGQFDYLNTRIDGFGSSNAITFEIGVQSQVTDQILIGAHVFSPGTVRINDTNEIPSRFNLGIQYKPTPKFFLRAEIEKLIDRPLSIQGGVDYKIINELYLRVGTSTNPTRLSFGVAYGFSNKFQFDLSTVNHEILGLTPAASFSYQSK